MINVKNSYISISDYEPNQTNLEKLLSYWDDVYHCYAWNLYSYDNDKKELRIPSGFSLGFLQKIIPDSDIKFDRTKDPSSFSSFNLNIEPRNEEQIEAINFLLSKDSKNNSQRMLCLKTGKGKTYCTINAIHKLKKKAIIIMDTDAIIQQWKEKFLEYTDLTEDDIYIISGSQSIDRILSKKSDTPYQIFLASHRTIANYGERNGWNSIDKFFRKIKVGVKVFDEAHVEFKNIISIDEHSNTQLTIYLTATPGRSNPSEDKLYKRVFDNIPAYYGLNSRYHDVVLVKYNSHPTENDMMMCVNKYGFNINAYYKYVFNNTENYDKFISSLQYLLDIILKQKGKVAILLHNIMHIDMLKNTLEELYTDIDIGLFYSKIKKQDLAKELDKQVILSTDKSLGKAIDIPNLQFLISTLPISSPIVTEQILGRLRYIPNKKVVYFDLVDVGFSVCRNQLNKRKSLLRKRAKSIKILNLN